MSGLDGNVEQTQCMSIADLAALGLDTEPAPAVSSTALIEIAAADLRAVSAAMSDDFTRGNLCGVHVEVQSIGRIILVATDGHVLGKIERTCAPLAVSWDVARVTLSADAIGRALKLCGRGRNALPILVEFGASGGHSAAHIIVGQARLTDVEASGPFPDWRQVVPKCTASTCAEPSINLAYIARFLPMADMLGRGGWVTMRRTDLLAPVLLRFADPGCLGVIMPVRP